MNALLAQNMPGMEFAPLILLTMLVSSGAAFISVIAAAVQRHALANRIASFCILTSLGSTALFFVLIRTNIVPVGYAIFSTPSVFGFMTHLFTRFQTENESVLRPQLTVASTIFLLSVAAVFCGLFFTLRRALIGL